ncbi:MAG: ribosome-associated translation inhibitor RaiA [Ulvibacter sp.]|jgi:ribosome-associated translation inhibitor RaiA
MKIQINIDSNTDESSRNQDYFVAQISESLKRYQSQISRVEVHIKNEGPEVKSCLIETRLEGVHPSAVINQAATVEHAISGAILKAVSSLDSTLGKLQNQ